MSSDTTALSYWLNWRFLICAIYVVIAMVVSTLIIWKCEGFNRLKDEEENGDETVGSMYEHEAWKTCSKSIHPVWLLAYRIIAFVVLSALLITNIVMDGGGIFFFYTQWTFSLVTLYFGIASPFSIYGCVQYKTKVSGDRGDNLIVDAEHGSYVAPTIGENANSPNHPRNLNPNGEFHARKTAGLWGYVFQIIYQTCAGAVMLTDSVFWFLIYPFLTDNDYQLHFLNICMHSMNAAFLFGDVILNGLRFPFFRIAYFILWTSIFVIFQWIIHACVSMWWPYPFLDLSSSYAPVWYGAVGLAHLPCYGLFAAIVRLKLCFSRSSNCSTT